MYVTREALDPFCQSPVSFDALVAEEERSCVLVKTVAAHDPGVAEQRSTERWPHHLPGDLVIGLTGQAAYILLRRRGMISGDWRGHGVRIRDARFSATVLVGETFWTRVAIERTRRMGEKLYVQFRFRMWKLGPDGEEIETYRSAQDAMFFPGS
jgi:hypothetical protein